MPFPPDFYCDIENSTHHLKTASVLSKSSKYATVDTFTLMVTVANMTIHTLSARLLYYPTMTSGKVSHSAICKSVKADQSIGASQFSPFSSDTPTPSKRPLLHSYGVQICMSVEPNRRISRPYQRGCFWPIYQILYGAPARAVIRKHYVDSYRPYWCFI